MGVKLSLWDNDFMQDGVIWIKTYFTLTHNVIFLLPAKLPHDNYLKGEFAYLKSKVILYIQY